LTHEIVNLKLTSNRGRAYAQVMDTRDLLDLYEERVGEDLYDAAKAAYEEALAAEPADPILLRDYGYLLEWGWGL
jgi:hypothetical protein